MSASDYSDEKGSSNSSLNERDEKNNKIQLIIQKYRNENQNLQEKNKFMETTIKNLKNENQNLQGNNKSMEKTIRNLQNENQSMQEKSKTMEKTIKNLQNENENHQESDKIMETTIRNLQNKNQNLQENNKSMEKIIRNLQNQNEEFQKKNQELQSILKQMKANIYKPSLNYQLLNIFNYSKPFPTLELQKGTDYEILQNNHIFQPLCNLLQISNSNNLTIDDIISQISNHLQKENKLNKINQQLQENIQKLQESNQKLEDQNKILTEQSVNYYSAKNLEEQRTNALKELLNLNPNAEFSQILTAIANLNSQSKSDQNTLVSQKEDMKNILDRNSKFEILIKPIATELGTTCENISLDQILSLLSEKKSFQKIIKVQTKKEEEIRNLCQIKIDDDQDLNISHKQVIESIQHYQQFQKAIQDILNVQTKEEAIQAIKKLENQIIESNEANLSHKVNLSNKDTIISEYKQLQKNLANLLLSPNNITKTYIKSETNELILGEIEKLLKLKNETLQLLQIKNPSEIKESILNMKQGLKSYDSTLGQICDYENQIKSIGDGLDIEINVNSSFSQPILDVFRKIKSENTNLAEKLENLKKKYHNLKQINKTTEQENDKSKETLRLNQRILCNVLHIDMTTDKKNQSLNSMNNDDSSLWDTIASSISNLQEDIFELQQYIKEEHEYLSNIFNIPPEKIKNNSDFLVALKWAIESYIHEEEQYYSESAVSSDLINQAKLLALLNLPDDLTDPSQAIYEGVLNLIHLEQKNADIATHIQKQNKQILIEIGSLLGIAPELQTFEAIQHSLILLLDEKRNYRSQLEDYEQVLHNCGIEIPENKTNQEELQDYIEKMEFIIKSLEKQINQIDTIFNIDKKRKEQAHIPTPQIVFSIFSKFQAELNAQTNAKIDLEERIQYLQNMLSNYRISDFHTDIVEKNQPNSETINPNNTINNEENHKDKNTSGTNSNDSINSTNDSINSQNDSINSQNDSINSPNDSINSPNDSINSPNDSINSPNDSINSPNDSENTVDRSNNSTNQKHESVFEKIKYLYEDHQLFIQTLSKQFGNSELSTKEVLSSSVKAIRLLYKIGRLLNCSSFKEIIPCLNQLILLPAQNQILHQKLETSQESLNEYEKIKELQHQQISEFSKQIHIQSEYQKDLIQKLSVCDEWLGYFCNELSGPTTEDAAKHLNQLKSRIKQLEEGKYSQSLKNVLQNFNSERNQQFQSLKKDISEQNQKVTAEVTALQEKIDEQLHYKSDLSQTLLEIEKDNRTIVEMLDPHICNSLHIGIEGSLYPLGPPQSGLFQKIDE